MEGKEIPSLEIQEWYIKFSELCNQNKLVIDSISCYYITNTETDFKASWIKFFQKNNISLSIFPPILQMELKLGGLTLDKNVLDSVKDYSNEFIELFFDNKNGGR